MCGYDLGVHGFELIVRCPQSNQIMFLLLHLGAMISKRLVMIVALQLQISLEGFYLGDGCFGVGPQLLQTPDELVFLLGVKGSNSAYGQITIGGMQTLLVSWTSVNA